MDLVRSKERSFQLVLIMWLAFLNIIPACYVARTLGVCKHLPPSYLAFFYLLKLYAIVTFFFIFSGNKFEDVGPLVAKVAEADTSGTFHLETDFMDKT